MPQGGAGGTRKGHSVEVPGRIDGEGGAQEKLQAGCLGFWEDTLLSAGGQRRKQVSWILEGFVLEWGWQGNRISGF